MHHGKHRAPFEDCSGEDCPSTSPCTVWCGASLRVNPESQRPRRLVVSRGATRIVTVALTSPAINAGSPTLRRGTLLPAVWTFLSSTQLAPRSERLPDFPESILTNSQALFKISRTITSKVKTIGTAKTAPAIPAILKPIPREIKVTNGLIPTAVCITLGTIKLFSAC